MRRRLLATVFACAGLSAPAVAADLHGGYVPPSGDPVYSPAPMVVGHLQVGFGVMNVDRGVDIDAEWGLFEGAGRANIPFRDWNLEAEVTGGAFFDDGENAPDIGVYGHLWRNWGGMRGGVFGGVGYHQTAIGTVGLEGEVDIGSLNLGGQASYNWGEVMGDDASAWGLRGWAEWYFSPNTKLGFDAAWWNVAADDLFGDADLWAVALGAEHRFDNTPISGFAEIAYTKIDDLDADAWSAMIGARIFMDGPGTTLRDHDQQVPFDYRFVPIIGIFNGIVQ